MLPSLDRRSREILRLVVDAYVETGEPVGSKAVAERLGMTLSPATIRHVMAELEAQGLLQAPHISAGRVPTGMGLRFFVDGILEVGDLGAAEKASLQQQCAAEGRNLAEMLARAGDALSGLTACAGLVLAPKTDRPLKQIDFVSLSPTQILVVLVTEDGVVENRVIAAPPGLPPASLTIAANYLNRRLVGRRLAEALTDIEEDIRTRRAELDQLTTKLVQNGLAVWAGQQGAAGPLLIRGQARLLEDVEAVADLSRIRRLFEALETEETTAKLLEAATGAEGVEIFIGSENQLFAHAGCSVIVAPYTSSRAGGDKPQVIGAIGVIGPVRMNYARIIPMVDYTARLVGRMLE